MVIIFNGDTLDLLKRLQQYSDKDQKLTLDFMMRNFKIMERESTVGVWKQPPSSEYADWKRKIDAHMKGIELMSKSFWPESYNVKDWE